MLFEMIVNGNKEKCTKVYDTLNCTEIYSEEELNYENSFYLHIVGESKNGLDAYSDIDDEDDLVDGYDMFDVTLKIKSLLLQCDIEVFEFNDEDKSVEHSRYHLGDELQNETFELSMVRHLIKFKHGVPSFANLFALASKNDDIKKYGNEHLKDSSDKLFINDSIIGKYEYAENNKLTEIVIGPDVSEIEIGAFQNCEHLREVVIESSLIEVIPDFCFQECKKLKKVMLNDRIRVIGVASFDGCSHLREIAFSPVLNSIGDNAFSYSGLSHIEIPLSVQFIKRDAFSDCAFLKSVKFNRDIKEIHVENAFCGCHRLNIEGFTVIDNQLFEYMGNQEEITIPYNIKRIHSYCFNGKHLKAITFTNADIIVDSNAFNDCKNLELIVKPTQMNLVKDWFVNCTIINRKYFGEQKNIILNDLKNDNEYEDYSKKIQDAETRYGKGMRLAIEETLDEFFELIKNLARKIKNTDWEVDTNYKDDVKKKYESFNDIKEYQVLEYGMEEQRVNFYSHCIMSGLGNKLYGMLFNISCKKINDKNVGYLENVRNLYDLLNQCTKSRLLEIILEQIDGKNDCYSIYSNECLNQERVNINNMYFTNRYELENTQKDGRKDRIENIAVGDILEVKPDGDGEDCVLDFYGKEGSIGTLSCHRWHGEVLEKIAKNKNITLFAKVCEVTPASQIGPRTKKSIVIISLEIE